MNNLKRIIGPAPSELPHEELINKLTLERNRVRQALERFQANLTKAKSPSKAKQRKLLEQSGFSIEELQELIRQEKEKQG